MAGTFADGRGAGTADLGVFDPYVFTVEDLHDAVCEVERVLAHPGERERLREAGR